MIGAFVMKELRTSNAKPLVIIWTPLHASNAVYPTGKGEKVFKNGPSNISESQHLSAIFQTPMIEVFAKIVHNFQLQKQKAPSEMFERVLNTTLNTSTIAMRCPILYHLYNLKNVKNTHGDVLLWVKLQAEAWNFNKINTPPWVFFTFFKIVQVYQIAQHITNLALLLFSCLLGTFHYSLVYMFFHIKDRKKIYKPDFSNLKTLLSLHMFSYLKALTLYTFKT